MIDRLQKKGWSLVNNQPHPLASLQGKALDSYKLVVLLGAKNRYGASYFQVFLRNESGEVSQRPVVIGLHNQGKYPGYNWIEIASFSPRVSFGSDKESLDIAQDGLVLQLMQHLADLIPPGGHMMVEYDSPEQQDTARSLALGIPPILTPLGYILFLVGCGSSFKDWHFAEGGTEGPRKLQGNKALNRQQAQIKSRETVQELTDFLARQSSAGNSELERAASNRASSILSELKRRNTGGVSR
jgi:hypothetical protein